MRNIRETAHLRSTLPNERVAADDSGQALPRRPQFHAYRCFLPDLAGFTSLRRVGPGPQRPPAVILAHRTGLWEGFNPAVADCGCRAPLAPHLVRPPFHSRFSSPLCQFGQNSNHPILACCSWSQLGIALPVRASQPSSYKASIRDCPSDAAEARQLLRSPMANGSGSPLSLD